MGYLIRQESTNVTIVYDKDENIKGIFLIFYLVVKRNCEVYYISLTLFSI